MSTTLPLPSSLPQRLNQVANKLRTLHLLRGLSLFVLVLAIYAGASFAADYFLPSGLPGAARGILLAGWLGMAGLLGWKLVRKASCPLPPSDLAALIEKHYPELGERLTSSVELSEHATPGHGSPALIALLLQETETHANRLDFTGAVKIPSVRWLAAGAALALVAFLLPSAMAPEEYRHLAQRFFFPWQNPTPLPDFAFDIAPGNSHAARGRPLTISASLTPRHSRIVMPPSAWLMMTREDGSTNRLEMTPQADDPQRFQAQFRLAGSFQYQVEAGNAVSEEFHLSAITPVELATDNPRIQVTPPAYAASAIDEESLTGMVDVTALEHSQLSFRFGFNRPAQAARIEWRPGNNRAPEGKDSGTPTIIPLPLNEDGLAAEWKTTARQPGSYRLVIEAEQGITTEREGGQLTVRPDQAPAAVKFLGREEVRSAQPFDRLPLEIALSDDIVVAGAEVEYRLARYPESKSEPMKLNGSGRDAMARLDFSLSGKVKTGDELEYRIRFRDNFPPEYGGPHVVYYPSESWLKLQIRSGAKSLREQDIQSRKDEVSKKLEEIRNELKQEQRKVMNARAESRNEEKLPERAAEILAEARKQNQSITQSLQEMSRQMGEQPGEEKLAEMTGNLARQEMRRTEEGLQEAANAKTTTQRRDESLRNSEDELNRAMAQLDKLKEANERVAQERMDQARVEELADRQRNLAEKAEEQAGKHPGKDSESPKNGEEIRKEQEKLAQELDRLADQSQPLKKALEEARKEQTRQAGEKARQLAKAQRELAKASEETEKKREAGLLDDLARKQEELAKKAENLSRQTEQPAQSNFAQPLKTEDASKAAESLRKGEAEKSQQEQDRAAREMDRLAADLDRASDVSRDPRNAARQLARLEESLMKKVREQPEAKKAEQREKNKSDQKAIRQAAEKLDLPRQRPDLQADHEKAKAALERAEKALEKGDPNEAPAAMEQARQALRDLANKLPSQEERRSNARKEVERLKQEQQQASRKAEEAAKAGEQGKNQKEEAARKQAEIAKSLEKMDAPGAEASRESAQKSAEKAEEALRKTDKNEQASAQADVRKKLDQLAQGLSGQPQNENSPDNAQAQGKNEEAAPETPRALPNKAMAEAARQLAREQRELREAVRKAGESLREQRRADSGPNRDNPLGKLAKEQADLARQAEKLAKDVSREQGEQSKQASQAKNAGESAKQAADQAEAGSVEEAGKSGSRTSEQLRNLARDLSQTPRGQGSPAKGDTLEDARNLAEKQDKLNQKMQAMANDAATQRGQQQARQDELLDQTASLAKELEDLGRSSQTPQTQSQAREAGQAARQAENAMRSAQAQSREGQQSPAQNQREQAARSLEEAARRSQSPSNGNEGQASQAGQAMQQARKDIDQARQNLQKNQMAQAAESMQQAAQDLAQAAQQLAQNNSPRRNPQQPSQSSEMGAEGGGALDPRVLPGELAPHAGKRWGELPGELRTKIVQQMKARYGEDYARMIKLYFEQIADIRKKSP